MWILLTMMYDVEDHGDNVDHVHNVDDNGDIVEDSGSMIMCTMWVIIWIMVIMLIM